MAERRPDDAGSAGTRLTDGGESAVERGSDEAPVQGGHGEEHVAVGDDAVAGPDDERSGKVVFMEALGVKRNAKVGVAVGLLFAVFVFVSFPGAYAPSRSMAWYVALGFVLMLSMAGFVAFLLTLGRAVRLSRDL